MKLSLNFAFLLSSLLLFSAALAADARPNFLFILVDDQSPFDLKIYNPSSPLDSPNLDRLAARGMVFDGAYHMGAFSGAVCMPSRHMIMSGRTVWHLGEPKRVRRRWSNKRSPQFSIVPDMRR